MSRRRYFEPFLGGGAVFFGLHAVAPFFRWVGGKRRAFAAISRRLHRLGCARSGCDCLLFGEHNLADVNPDLVAAYRAVRDDPRGLVEIVASWPKDRAGYTAVKDDAGRHQAARFLYLNLYAFNGLWRVNQRGQMNVQCDEARFASVNLSDLAVRLTAASTALGSAVLSHTDFSAVLSACGRNCAAYLDPPYLPDETSKFKAYSKDAEKPAEFHRRLAREAREACERGAQVVISNSPAALLLYEAEFKDIGFEVETLSAQRNIGVGKDAAAGREVARRQDEILVTLYPREDGNE